MFWYKAQENVSFVRDTPSYSYIRVITIVLLVGEIKLSIFNLK